jgi:hypothetical protein
MTLREQLPHRLLTIGRAGGPLADAAGTASQVILFGSRALGLAREDSDWDLLCVGVGATHRDGTLDVVWITEDHLTSEAWLTSELAGHIAGYGLWLRGSDTWSQHVRVGPAAIRAKRAAIAIQIREIERWWTDLTPGYRAKHLRLLRRDAQRLRHLMAKRPVPPADLLDEQWRSSSRNPRRLPRLLGPGDVRIAMPRLGSLEREVDEYLRSGD